MTVTARSPTCVTHPASQNTCIAAVEPPHDRGPTLLKGYGACLRSISCDEDFSSSHTSCLKELFSQNFQWTTLHKTINQWSQMIGAEMHFKGLESGGQLLQPPAVIPLKPPIVYISAVCAHMVPPPPHRVSVLTCGAHGYTSNIWSFYLFFCFLLCHLFFTLWAIYVSSAICLQREGGTQSLIKPPPTILLIKPNPDSMNLHFCFKTLLIIRSKGPLDRIKHHTSD